MNVPWYARARLIGVGVQCAIAQARMDIITPGL